jgi:hypothetical protein
MRRARKEIAADSWMALQVANDRGAKFIQQACIGMRRISLFPEGGNAGEVRLKVRSEPD